MASKKTPNMVYINNCTNHESFPVVVAFFLALNTEESFVLALLSVW